jgi:hypothetical protein
VFAAMVAALDRTAFGQSVDRVLALRTR